MAYRGEDSGGAGCGTYAQADGETGIAPAGPPILEVSDLAMSFRGVRALDGVSFQVREGGRYAILGPNGAGKSTLFHTIGGQLTPTSGTIKYRGTDIVSLTAAERARQGITRTFQAASLFPELTVYENVLIVFNAKHGIRTGLLYRPARGEIAAELETFIFDAGLSDIRNAKAQEISYGEQKRLEILLAYALAPRLLLLDEPTAGLSPWETAAVVDMLRKLDPAITLIFVEHDMQIAFDLAQDFIVLDLGKLVAAGNSESIRANKDVARIYLRS